MDRSPRRHARGRPPHPDVLTPAEWRVLEELRRGATNTEIAARLGLSLNTVKTHVSSMLAKLDLRDRRALAEWRGEPSSATRRLLARLGLAVPFGWLARRESAFAVVVRAAAIAAVTAGASALGAAVIISGVAGAGGGHSPRTVLPTPTATPPDTSTPGPGWDKAKVNFADASPLGADPVSECPLDAAGCEAVESLLAIVEAGDTDSLVALLGPGMPRDAQGDVLIGGKEGMQIVGHADLAAAVTNAKANLDTVAIGCPQRNALGPEPGACEGLLFVLTLDVSPPGTHPRDRKGLAFMFVRTDDRFEVHQLAIEPKFDVEYGGSYSSFALPLELTGGRRSLWYTPWRR